MAQVTRCDSVKTPASFLLNLIRLLRRICGRFDPAMSRNYTANQRLTDGSGILQTTCFIEPLSVSRLLDTFPLDRGKAGMGGVTQAWLPTHFPEYPLIILFALAIVLMPTLSLAGAIVGTITNSQTRKPLEGVTVTVDPTFVDTVSDSAGSFVFDTVEPGTYTLFFSKQGFEALARNDVYVAGEGKKRLQVEMVPQVLRLDKMVVRGRSFRKAPDMATSTKIMNFDEILRAPGALVDVQRVVQNLPSVASGGDNVNEVVVRGGVPGENLLIMDNIEIPNPNHFADQGSGGGVVSLINPLLVKGLTFNAGAPPAQYGHKGSSVIDVQLRDGNKAIILGGVDLGLSGVGGHVEGPLWPHATFMASGHRSYLDFITNFTSTVAIPEFWGLQGKLSQAIGPHKVYANGIYGRNEIVIENSIEDLGLDYDVTESGGVTYASGVNWDAYWGDRFSTNLVLSATGNTFDRLAYDPAGDTGFVNASREQEQTGKLSAAIDLESNNRILVGAYGRRADFDIDIWDIPDTSTTGVITTETVRRHDVGYKYGGYISAILHAFDRARVVPGVRVDGFTYNHSLSVSPRLSGVLSLNESTDLTAAFGLQHQQPEYSQLVHDPRNKDLRPKRATTGVAGFERFLGPLDAKVTVEGFYKHYARMPVEYSLLTVDSLDESNVLVDTGEGRSFGLEVFAQKKLTKSVFWTFAYALSKSLYKDVRPGHEGEWYDGDYDFRHSFTATGGWKLELLDKDWYKRLQKKLWFRLLSPIMPIADRIEISGKWRFLGGRPYTKPRYDPIEQQWYTNTQADLNSERYPAYHRLDVRYERRYGFGLLHLIYYFDFQNIYNRENIWNYVYSDKWGKRTPIYQFPFFPVGGIIIGF